MFLTYNNSTIHMYKDKYNIILQIDDAYMSTIFGSFVKNIEHRRFYINNIFGKLDLRSCIWFSRILIDRLEVNNKSHAGMELTSLTSSLRL